MFLRSSRTNAFYFEWALLAGFSLSAIFREGLFDGV